MQAANEGVEAADPNGEQSIGIRISSTFEQDVNAVRHDRPMSTARSSTRLHHFVLVSDAFVVVPGGIGTTLETMMIWQLLQVRKLHETPLILIGQMYAGFRRSGAKEHMLRPRCPSGRSDRFGPSRGAC